MAVGMVLAGCAGRQPMPGAQPLNDGFLEGNPFDKTPWRGFLTQNEPGKAAAGAPVFIAQRTGTR